MYKVNIEGPKGDINSNRLRVDKFNTSLTWMDISSRQKIYKETVTLNDTENPIDLSDIFKICKLNPAEYTNFLSAHEKFIVILYVKIQSKP